MLFWAVTVQLKGKEFSFGFSLDVPFRRRRMESDGMPTHEDVVPTSAPTLRNSNQTSIYSGGHVEHVGVHDIRGRRRRLQANNATAANACGGQITSPFDTVEEFLEYFQEFLSYNALLRMIGPINEKVDYELNGLLVSARC